MLRAEEVITNHSNGVCLVHFSLDHYINAAALFSRLHAHYLIRKPTFCIIIFIFYMYFFLQTEISVFQTLVKTVATVTRQRLDSSVHVFVATRGITAKVFNSYLNPNQMMRTDL